MTKAKVDLVYYGEFSVVTIDGKGDLLQQRIPLDDGVLAYECFKEERLHLTVVYQQAGSSKLFSEFHPKEVCEITYDKTANTPENYCR